MGINIWDRKVSERNAESLWHDYLMLHTGLPRSLSIRILEDERPRDYLEYLLQLAGYNRSDSEDGLDTVLEQFNERVRSIPADHLAAVIAHCSNQRSWGGSEYGHLWDEIATQLGKGWPLLRSSNLPRLLWGFYRQMPALRTPNCIRKALANVLGPKEEEVPWPVVLDAIEDHYPTPQAWEGLFSEITDPLDYDRLRMMLWPPLLRRTQQVLQDEIFQEQLEESQRKAEHRSQLPSRKNQIDDKFNEEYAEEKLYEMWRYIHDGESYLGVRLLTRPQPSKFKALYRQVDKEHHELHPDQPVYHVPTRYWEDSEWKKRWLYVVEVSFPKYVREAFPHKRIRNRIPEQHRVRTET